MALIYRLKFHYSVTVSKQQSTKTLKLKQLALKQFHELAATL